MPRMARHVSPLIVLVAVVAAVAWAARSTLPSRPLPIDPPGGNVANVAARIDGILHAKAAAAGVERAATADDLLILRRMWLGFAGTIPSLEEIRRFEADSRPDRLDRWLAAILADRRSAEHLATTLAESFVGVDVGPPFVFRRDRFTAWLADSIHAGRPFDAIVRHMVADDGLWTGTPSVNFITQAARAHRVDENLLAGRVARSMLGTRLDCAECHDHPFAAWTQRQFEGLAACFAAVRLSPLGVRDSGAAVLTIGAETAATGMMPEDATPLTRAAARRVSPTMPFGEEWATAGSSPRQRLAEWLTHPANRRFERGVANRCWAIAFGRPWHDPVDDLPDPAPQVQADDLLDILGADFRAGGCDLRRTLAVIGSTAVFRRESKHPDLESPGKAAAIASTWAAFPLSQLAPAAMISSMVQAGSVRTIDPDSHLVVRTIQFLRSVDFVREYGGSDRDEPATIPQALVRMNGRLVRELCEANAFSASGRIAGLASSGQARLEAVFLACLCRQPDARERTTLTQVVQGSDPASGVEDIFWSLFNSAEFCWNH